jgi:hypothetical protein
MSPEVVAACTHVRTAFAALADQQWKTVVRELETAWRVGHGASDRQLAYLLPQELDPSDTQTISEQTDTLTFACGLPSRPTPGSSPAAPDRRTVVVSTQAVDGVVLGTAADEAERRLRHSLGDADTQTPTGCEGESGRWLTWGTFRVFLGGKGTATLQGWTLQHGLSRVFYALPYDVQPGDVIRDAMRRVPGAAGQTKEHGYEFRTDRAPELSWASVDAAGDVETIAYRVPDCA